MDRDKGKGDLDFWREQISAFKKSGLTQKEYCRKEKLNFHAFQYRLYRVIKKEADLSFIKIPVSFSPQSASPVLSLSIGARYKVDIPDNFNPLTLTQLVNTLEEINDPSSF